MYVLGIWDGHDAGAALVDVARRRIVCAVNEERLTRRKLEVGFPHRSIAACLAEAGLAPDEVTAVAVPTFDVAKTITRLAPSLKERYYRLRRRQVLPGRWTAAQKAAKYVLTQWGPSPWTRAASRWALGRELARAGLVRARLYFVPHHAAHAAAAAYTSGWERAVVVTLDGIGDGLAGSVWRLDDGRLRRLAAIPGRDSLGIFFEHVTNLLNLRELEDEGKVMAMAAYAYPMSNGDNPLADLFAVDGLRLRCRLGPLALRRYLERTLFRTPSEQFAAMAQAVVEATAARLVAEAVRAGGLGRVAYAGGVASNIKANLRIVETPGVDELFVFPHMGDGGIALGAALWIAATKAEDEAFFDLGDLLLGPTVTEVTIERAVRESGLAFERVSRIEDAVADRLAAGEVVLWFQGRMEYGPRALGARSILGRADRPEIRDRLNLRLKRRVWYQPFCPSVLEEEAPRLFRSPAGRVDRYMTMAYRTSPEGAARLAAVVGPDGTCRPQMVGPKGGRFRRLLERMAAKTGTGAVLNTSFNLHGEPIVAGPDDALRTFRASGADALAIGDFLVRPEGAGR